MKYFALCLFILTILCTAKAQQIVKASNLQLVSTPGVQLVAAGGITFTGSTSFQHNGRLTINASTITGNADWSDSTTAGVISNTSGGHVLFNSTAALQQVYGKTAFDSISINGAGINFKQSNEIRKWLGLLNGLAYLENTGDSIYVSDGSLHAIMYNTDSLATTSWVHGKLSRRLNSAGNYFFPVGKTKTAQNLYAPVKIEKATSAGATFSIQYFPDIPVNHTAINASLHHISELEYWTITSHSFSAAGDDDATVSLSWRAYSQVGPTAAIRDSLLVAHYFFDGSLWLWQPEFNFLLPNHVAGNTNFGFVKSNKIIPDFSMPHLNFTLGTRTFANALPLQISSLSAKADGCTNMISFNADNLSGYEKVEVEWNKNNKWITIANFAPQQSPRQDGSYSATHFYPHSENNFYRLKLISANGKLQYSQVISARPQCLTNNIKVFPIPFTSQFSINGLAGKNTLQLTAMNGQILYTTITEKTSLDISVQHLPPGPYLLMVTNAQGSRQTLKLIKQ